MAFSLNEIFSVALILFSLIDIVGSVPVLIAIKKKGGHIQPLKATLISGILMVGFVYVGQSILKLFALDIPSFSIAGAIVILIIAFEMILGITLMKETEDEKKTGSIVPIAFPLIAGAGTLSTLLSLRTIYKEENLLVGIFLNLILIYIVLRNLAWIEKVIGKSGTAVLRRVFGVILLAISVKILKSNISFPL
ncbi:MAG: hypothetical protein CRN43_18610, partial [Candidatus Nephrothrix sp. EaCA]